MNIFNFYGCCGASIISGFGYDNEDGRDYFESLHNRTKRSRLKKAADDLYGLICIRKYNGLIFVILNEHQKPIYEDMLELFGFELKDEEEGLEYKQLYAYILKPKQKFSFNSTNQMKKKVTEWLEKKYA